MGYTRRGFIGAGLIAAPLVTRPSLAQVIDGVIYGSLPTFFVAASGNDANPGTQSSPWKSISKVNSASLAAGTRVLFNGGDTFTGGPIVPPVSNLQFGSFGTGRATISSATGSDGITVSNLSNIQIYNLIFVGGSADPSVNTGVGIRFSASGANSNQYSGNSAMNCDVSLYKAGIYIANDSASNNTGFVNPIVSMCVVHNNGDGIITYSNNTGVHSHTNVLIQNCVSFSNGAVGTVAGNRGSGIELGGCVSGTVTGCVAHTNGAVSTGGPVGIWTYDSANVVISFCESYSNRSTGSDGGGYDIDGGCTNCIVEYCYSHGNDAYGFLLYAYSGAPTTGNNTIRFCISENDGLSTDGQGSIIVGTGGAVVQTGNLVYGNTIYQNNASIACVYFENNAALGCAFYNNIFYAANNYRFIDTTGLTPTALIFKGNDYFGTGNFSWGGTSYANFAAWQTATGQEKISGVNVGLTSNPGLNNPGAGGTVNTGSYVTPALLATLTAYTITGASAMYRAGLNLTADFSVNPGPQDFYSNVIAAAALSVGADCLP